MAVQISKKRKFVFEEYGIFKAEVNVSHSGDGWRWVLWSWGPSYTNQDRNHYHGHKDRECSWWGGLADLGIVCCGSEEMWLPWGQCRAICWKGSHRSLCATVQAESLHYRLLGGLAVWRAYYGVLKFIMGPKAVRSWCLENSKDRGLNPWSLWMASWSTAGTLLTTMLTPPHATCCSDRVCWVSRYKDHAALGPNR